MNLKIIKKDNLDTKIIMRTISLIIFFDKNKKILLQDRTGISKFGEEWGYFGGSVEKNETPKQTIIRETKEELDFDLINFNFKYIGKHDIVFCNKQFF
jgi:8-oxo-dGTP pyrophosphatase MutT (NUDIX family)